MEQREIKFKGKRVDNGEWIYGGFMVHDEIKLCIASKEEVEQNKKCLIMMDGMADWNLPCPINGYEVIPETVSQFTGCYDCNKRGIYEGDVLKSHNPSFSKPDQLVAVKFSGSNFVVYNPKCCKVCSDGAGYICPLDEFEGFEVVGNLYDNGDLL